MNTPDRPLAEVGPVALPESLASTMRAFGEERIDTLKRARRCLTIAMEQDCEPYYWETVRTRAYQMDMLPREGHAIADGLDRLEKSTLPEDERSKPDPRMVEILDVLMSITNDIARRRIYTTMASTRVMEGITLRLLPDDVVRSYNDRTRERFLKTLADAPRDYALYGVGGATFSSSLSGYAHHVEATPTEGNDGLILTSDIARHRVFGPRRWNETPILLPAVRKGLQKHDWDLIDADNRLAMDTIETSTDHAMKRLQEEWAAAPDAVPTPGGLWEFLYARGVLKRPPSPQRKDDVVAKAKASYARNATDWIALLHKGLNRDRLDEVLG